jgi:hypothetical protein
LSRLGHNLELHGSFGFLLHDGCTISDRPVYRDVTNLHFDDAIAAQLAVDHQIEKRSVAQSSMLVRKKAYSQNVAWFEWAFCANQITCNEPRI